MKNCTPEQRAVELQKAKESAKEWTSSNRTWDYRFICELLPHRPSRIALVNNLLCCGFFVNNMPHETELAVDPADDAAPSTSDIATSTADALPTSPENRSSSPPSPDPDEGRGDPS